MKFKNPHSSNEYATTEESGEECAKSPSGSVRNRGSEKNSAELKRDLQSRRNLQNGQKLNSSLTAVVMSSSAVRKQPYRSHILCINSVIDF